jgi:hypothetical protein
LSAPEGGAAVQGAGVPTKRTGREVSIDWLEASVKDVESLEVFGLLVRHLGPQFRRGACDVLRDDESRFLAKGPFGLSVEADRRGQEDSTGEKRTWVSVRMPGELCRTIGTDKLLDLVVALDALPSLKVSRLDVALDDFDKTFTSRVFAEACVGPSLDAERAPLGPQVVTRVRRGAWDWSRRLGGCFWLGGKKSPRLLRVYDKEQESGGLIPSTRVELQSRNEFGTALARRLVEARSAGGSLAEVFFQHLVSFVDLREPQADRSSSQGWPRMPFWAAFVGDAQAVRTGRRSDSRVRTWIRHMVRQCGGFLGVMLRAFGVTPKVYALVGVDEAAGPKVARAIREILGPALPELSGEHEIRLEQVLRERARKIPGMRGFVGDR